MPMIDCCMIVVTTDGDTPRCIGVTTASKIGVEKATEDTDAVKLVVKNVLVAQKPAQSTVTGHTITLTDNVTILELLEILEGGTITQYEKISYPNCTGNPIGLGSEDNVFRINEYTINSAPAKGQAPYTLTIVDALPTISET